MEKQWLINFAYNNLGRGNLELKNDSLTGLSIKSRTGSMRQFVTGLELINELASGVYKIKDQPVDTNEPGMIYPDGHGEKVRLYKEDGTYTHLLIHYDAGLGGTLGCIGTLSVGETKTLMERIRQILKLQAEILVYVNVEIVEPKPEYDPAKNAEAGVKGLLDAGIAVATAGGAVIATKAILAGGTSPTLENSIAGAIGAFLALIVGYIQRRVRNRIKNK